MVWVYAFALRNSPVPSVTSWAIFLSSLLFFFRFSLFSALCKRLTAATVYQLSGIHIGKRVITFFCGIRYWIHEHEEKSGRRLESKNLTTEKSLRNKLYIEQNAPYAVLIRLSLMLRYKRVKRSRAEHPILCHHSAEIFC
jgi:hypothetical protein